MLTAMPSVRTWILIASGAFGIVAFSYAMYLVHDTEDVVDTYHTAGSVDAEVQTDLDTVYGFGASKRFIVINITEIGGLHNIDAEDKLHATMRVYGESLHEGEDAEDGSTVYDIGLEYKGMEYYGLLGAEKTKQAALSFAIWKWDEDENEWDDDDERLYFEEKLEDFVLRPGCQDPSLVRDYAAPYMAGAFYERTMVELLLVHPGDRVSYEGIYMFAQHIKRRMLDKNGHIASSGKKSDCDDVDDGNDASALVAETMLQFELRTHPQDDARCVKYHNFEPKYPKCKHMESSKMTRCNISDAYISEFNHLSDVMTSEVSTEETMPERTLEATLTNMAKVLTAELILLDQGFATDSEHMFAHPLESGATIRELQAVLWDHDEYEWRLLDPDTADAGRMAFWQYKSFRANVWKFWVLYEPFLKILRENGVAWIQEQHSVIQGVIDQRRFEDASGVWDRHNQRWDFWGRHIEHKRAPWERLHNSHLLRPKATLAKELDFAEDWYRRRSDALSSWITTVEAGDIYFVFMDQQAPRIAVFVPSIILGIISAVLFIIWYVMGRDTTNAIEKSVRLPNNDDRGLSFSI